jgi:hypothetical protein
MPDGTRMRVDLPVDGQPLSQLNGLSRNIVIQLVRCVLAQVTVGTARRGWCSARNSNTLNRAS